MWHIPCNLLSPWTEWQTESCEKHYLTTISFVGGKNSTWILKKRNHDNCIEHQDTRIKFHSCSFTSQQRQICGTNPPLFVHHMTRIQFWSAGTRSYSYRTLYGRPARTDSSGTVNPEGRCMNLRIQHTKLRLPVWTSYVRKMVEVLIQEII